MYVYLRNLRSYDTVVRLHVNSLSVQSLSRKKNHAELFEQTFNGWCQLVGELLVAFYWYPTNRELHLLVDKTDIALIDGMSLESNYADAWQDEFVIRQDNEKVFTHLYSRPEIDTFDRLRLDMAYVDYEDLDIFVLASNIWNDPMRRAGVTTGAWEIELPD